ncbi:MAG: 3-hydroxyacyl-ACP dehydratase FabZ [Xanthomonadales bacterium]|nr:3-hydroxyacyl-ACP dehydratase FabZ [Xanthomonadales bacterium]
MSEPTAGLSMPVTVEQIKELLPHRFPFLLVDRVVELVPDVSVAAIKNVTFNEPFFQGHFQNHSVMPGVLIIEAMAQAAGLLTQLSNRIKGNDDKPFFYLVKVDNARFSAMVTPGDQLRLEVAQKRVMRGMGLFVARASVDGREVASCELMCAARTAQ